MGMNHIRLFPGNDLLENLPGRHHLSHRTAVERGVIMLCPCRFDLRDVYATVGNHDDLVPLPAQLPGELYNMGLSAADIQRHSRHQDLHNLFSF